MNQSTPAASEQIAPRHEYLVKLHDLLTEHFDASELQGLCFQLGLDYDELPGSTKPDKARELILYLNRRRRIHELVEAGKTLRPTVQWEDELPQHHRVPFVDRDETKRFFLSSQVPPYYIIDAPAGYGKTDLLLELERDFQSIGWVCAYVSADEHPRLRNLVKALFRELGLGEPTSGPDAKKLGSQLANALTQQKMEEITRKGIVFLIDLGKIPSDVLIRELLDTFIPSFQKNLQYLDFFSNAHNRFRVLLAGRYLATHKEISTTSLPLSIYPLPPFSYKILLDTARKYLDGLMDTIIVQVSAHIMHLTGGHPGCMASLLELYKRKCFPSPDFVEDFQQDIQEIINYEIEQVRQSTPTQLQNVMDALGMFRYFNPNTLNHLTQEGCVPGYSDAYTLAYDLTTSYLMDWDGPLLRNDSMHRLLALRLREQAAPCILAQDICLEYLKTLADFESKPEPWIIEYLYQYLQRFAPVVQDSAERAKLKQQFLQELVPDLMQNIVLPLHKSGKNIRWYRDSLERALEKDEEFIFTVNYYLREEQYDDEPFQEFKDTVLALLA